MSDLMIDNETLSTHPEGVITSIGLVIFDRSGTPGTYIDARKFQVDAQSCQDIGMKLDANTVMWWLDQDKEAQLALKQGSPVQAAALSLIIKDLLKVHNIKRIWGHGSAFDCVGLNSLVRLCGHKELNFRLFRDTRTLFELANITKGDWNESKEATPGPKHCSLVDSQRQAFLVQLSMERLNDKA